MQATFGSSVLTGVHYDVFVAKLSAQGDFVWAASGGGNANDYSRGVAVDSTGSAFLTGFFQSSAATFGTTTLTLSGTEQIFAAKLSPQGNFLWAASAGGGGSDYARGVAVDSAGMVYLAGFFSNSATFGTTTLTAGGMDLFVAKLSPQGNFVWADAEGGGGPSLGYDLALDGAGHLVATGEFGGAAYFGGTSLGSNGATDVVVWKMQLP